ncbi:MAG: response regulator [Chloroflexota bacterium]
MPRVIKSDSTRIRQVLVNLLSNAVKFTQAGEVLVTVKNRGEVDAKVDIYFEVQDSGIGIPQSKMDRLFKPFSQVDASTTRKYGGTGLGLVICRRLCRLMGGEIGVKSEPEVGSTFYFNIVAPPVDETAELFTTQTMSQMVSGKRALIVDDNETNRKVLAYFLKSWGVGFESAASADAALNLLKNDQRFDFALVDYHMPGGMDGLGLAHQMQTLYPPMPIIMLSSSFDMSDAPRPSNIVSWQYKPIKPDRVYKEIARAIHPQQTKAQEMRSQPQERHPDQFDRERKLKILLAEDNVVNQKVFSRVLGKLGYNIDVAADGEEAIEAVERQPYDIIFMDVQMPNMDGIEATSGIRRLEQEISQPLIVALTAEKSPDVVKACQKAGMEQAIEKPAHAQEIIQMLSIASGKVSNS